MEGKLAVCQNVNVHALWPSECGWGNFSSKCKNIYCHTISYINLNSLTFDWWNTYFHIVEYFAAMKENKLKKNGRTERRKRPITIILEDFNTTFSQIDKTSRHKITEYIEDLNSLFNHLDLIDILRRLHPTMAEYVLFSWTHGTWIMLDPIYKTNLTFSVWLN